MTISTPKEFSQLIRSLDIEYTVAEVHGFLSGLIAGGVRDDSWQTLTYQIMNDGHAFSQTPLKSLIEFYHQLSFSFDEGQTLFSLWENEAENAFVAADRISEWSVHFLLGLGLAQPKMECENDDDLQEAINDLNEISQLGYDDEEDENELWEAVEGITEYLRIVTLFLHAYFASSNVSRENHSKLH